MDIGSQSPKHVLRTESMDCIFQSIPHQNTRDPVGVNKRAAGYGCISISVFFPDMFSANPTPDHIIQFDFLSFSCRSKSVILEVSSLVQCPNFCSGPGLNEKRFVFVAYFRGTCDVSVEQKTEPHG